MTKFKKIAAAIVSVQILALAALGTIPAQAKTKPVIKPNLQMVTQPKTEYKPGDRISFTVTSPNYGGKVEYRVILWNGTTKKQSELWKTPKTGYYYKGWQPSGNYKFTINWPANGMEPGAYSLTVLVRRVGANASYDSFVKTQAFWIKSDMKLSGSYYESTNGKFKMKFPNEFKVEESSENGMNYAMASSEDKDFPLFFVFTTKTQQGDTLDNEMSSLKEDLLGEVTGSTVKFTEKSRKKVTLGDQEGYLVEYDLEASNGGSGEKIKEVAIVTLNDKNTNIVTLLTTQEDWALNSSVYMQSLLSFVPVNTPSDSNTQDNQTPAAPSGSSDSTAQPDANSGNSTTTENQGNSTVNTTSPASTTENQGTDAQTGADSTAADSSSPKADSSGNAAVSSADNSTSNLSNEQVSQ